MDHLEVTPARLQTAATEIRHAAKAIDELVAQLEQDAAGLRAQWAGEAHDAFDTAQARFTELMASRTELVGTISAALENLAVGYSTLDLEAARALGATA
ncbi:WXG100 family type VII secretion target [Microbacterium caowuchunii]|uniref:WXG100 family type VII secretion target n=1 Tax=Microbacterium caowuchunii TaxID=2614638 RepID=UPI001783B2CB|nr:WXG100 family type VII secretion target [Microbacterium caowuchunii]